MNSRVWRKPLSCLVEQNQNNVLKSSDDEIKKNKIKIQDSLISYENWIAKRHQSKGTYVHFFMKLGNEQFFSKFLYWQTMSVIFNLYVKLTGATRFARDGNACGIFF